MDGDGGRRKGAAASFGGGFWLGGVNLEGEGAAGEEMRGHLGYEGAVGRKTVATAACQGEARLVCKAWIARLLISEIGEIGDDEPGGRAEPGEQVAAHESDARSHTMCLCVCAGNGERVRGEVGGNHARVSDSDGNRNRDSSAASAHIQYA